MSTFRRTAVLASAAVLTLAACGGSGGESTTATDAPTASPTVVATVGPDSSSDAPAEPSAVEAVMVPLADGSQLDFNSLRGQDVMFWFWAPW